MKDGIRPLMERFMDRVGSPDPVTGCWIWRGSTVGGVRKYGRFNVMGHTWPAHRLSLLLFRGIPLWRGPYPQVDHLCRATMCVNPDHLEVVSPAVNCQRRRKVESATCRSGRHPIGEYYIHPDGKRECRLCRKEARRRHRLRWRQGRIEQRGWA